MKEQKLQAMVDRLILAADRVGAIGATGDAPATIAAAVKEQRAATAAVGVALAQAANLLDSARAVVTAWESGDLAGAVNVLDADADALAEALGVES